MKNRRNNKGNKSNEKKEAEKNILAYRSDKDRCMGLAGMAVSLAGMDALETVASVSVDYDGPMVRFTGQYYYGGSPHVSPKATWHRLIENFRITTGIAIGNILARCVASEPAADPTRMLRTLEATVQNEGMLTCQLEEDEVAALMQQLLRQEERIFANRRLHPALRQLASLIEEERELSGRSLAERLRYLRII